MRGRWGRSEAREVSMPAKNPRWAGEMVRMSEGEYVRRVLVDEVFPALRKYGVVCRANFLCCGSCASYGLGQYMEAKPKKSGAVYWHKQDEASIVDANGVYLGYGANRHHESYVEENDVSTVQIGLLVKEICEDKGLAVKWDGTAMERIFVGYKAPLTAQELYHGSSAGGV